MMLLPLQEKRSYASAEGRAQQPAAGPRPRAGVLAVIVAAFVGPWAVWFSAIAQGHGWVSWRLPQGIVLWTAAAIDTVVAVALAIRTRGRLGLPAGPR